MDDFLHIGGLIFFLLIVLFDIYILIFYTKKSEPDMLFDLSDDYKPIPLFKRKNRTNEEEKHD